MNFIACLLGHEYFKIYSATQEVREEGQFIGWNTYKIDRCSKCGKERGSITDYKLKKTMVDPDYIKIIRNIKD